MLTEATFSVDKSRTNRSFPLGRTILVGFSLLALCLPVYSAAQNPPTSEPARPAVINPKAQAILDKTLQALGGPAFLSFKTLTTTGRSFAIADEQTVGFAPFESFVEYPDKRRFSYGKKLPVVLINNGDKGWEIDRYGTVSQKAEERRRWQLINRFSIENLLRLRIHEPGMLVQDGGEDFVDEAPVRMLSMVDALQNQITLYVHRSTNLPIRIAYHVLNPISKDWDDYVDVYGDYKAFQGIQTPMHITRFLNDDRVSETYRNTAKYNESYPAGTFDQPQ
jgi:hypothetical protein